MLAWWSARQRSAALALALLAAVGALSVYVGQYPSSGSNMRDSSGNPAIGIAGSASAAASALAGKVKALFDGRSPGERVAGALYSTKTARHAAARPRLLQPRERALGKVFTPTAAPPSLAEVVTPPVAPPVLQQTLGEVLTPPVQVAGGTPIVPPSFPGGIIPGTPPGTTTPPTTPEVPVVPPAVPEPSTWMMMLLGFAVVGRMVRKQPQRARLFA